MVVYAAQRPPSDEGAVSEADWGRESLKAFALLVNTGKDGTCSLPQSLRDSSLIRGSLVGAQQPTKINDHFQQNRYRAIQEVADYRVFFCRCLNVTNGYTGKMESGGSGYEGGS